MAIGSRPVRPVTVRPAHHLLAVLSRHGGPLYVRAARERTTQRMDSRVNVKSLPIAWKGASQEQAGLRGL